MKYLVLALLLSTQLHLLHGACYRFIVEEGATTCEDPTDHDVHDINASWRNSACQSCTCGQCCDAFSVPISFPDDCMKEFDKAECRYKVFKKDDPTQTCPVFKAVGK